MAESYIIVKYYSTATGLPSGENVVDLGDNKRKIIIPPNITDLSYMFGEAADDNGDPIPAGYGPFKKDQIEYIDIRGFDATNITSMYNMFFGCTTPKIIGLSNLSNPNCTNTAMMFRYCSNLKEIDVRNMTITANSDEMFAFSGLQTLTLGGNAVALGKYVTSGCSKWTKTYVYSNYIGTNNFTFGGNEYGDLYVPSSFMMGPVNSG